MSTSSLFRKPFSPKKAPPRKATTISPLQMDAAERSREFGLDFNHAHMQLGDQHFQFDADTGEWFDDETGQYYHYSQSRYSQRNTNNNNNSNNVGNQHNTHFQQQLTAQTKEMHKLQKSSQKSQEENNLLRVKNEVLIDMIAEVYSEFRLKAHK